MEIVRRVRGDIKPIVSAARHSGCRCEDLAILREPRRTV